MELAFGLLFLFLAAPLLCRANVDCSGVEGFLSLPEDESSYVTYEYVLNAAGTICESVTQNCFATIPNHKLRQRTWYLTNSKINDGVFYKPNFIQSYNIQCPPFTVLHLFPQYLSTETDMNGVCQGFDSILINVPGEFTENLCGDESDRTSTLNMLYNEGLGMIFTGGNATVEFCSNGNAVVGLGYVIRAMCIDPSQTLLPYCVDYNEVKMTPKGSDFIDRIFQPFAPPSKTNILHKRSADLTSLSRREANILELMLNGKLLNRKKRSFLTGLTTFELLEGQRVIYENSMLSIDFNNGFMSETFDVKWLITNSDLLSTRFFDVNVPSQLMLVGPGKVDIFDGIAVVDYTVSEDMIPQLLIESQEILEIINLIANYTYFNYIDPYPVICNTGDAVSFFPLPIASRADARYRFVNSLDFIQEDIQNGTCSRVVRINIAPARNSRMEANILDFCRFFYYSCNAMLRAACAEALNLDRISG